jgi:hypothetical protein
MSDTPQPEGVDVRRYSLCTADIAPFMEACDGGDFVRFEDYERLRAEVERLRAELTAKDAELNTERELRKCAEAYNRAVKELCDGRDVKCALHVSEPIYQLRAKLAEKDAEIERLTEQVRVFLEDNDEMKKMLATYGVRYPTDEQVNRFLREFDEGKHPLSPEGKCALEKARIKFMKWLAEQKANQ